MWVEHPFSSYFATTRVQLPGGKPARSAPAKIASTLAAASRHVDAVRRRHDNFTAATSKYRFVLPTYS